jgi:hypothetical protein
MAKKREVRCQEFDVNACTIIHASKGEKKRHDREYHSKNSAIGSREGFYNVVITRDFSKTLPYYYCTGLGCKTKTNRAPFYERPYSKVQIHPGRLHHQQQSQHWYHVSWSQQHLNPFQ